MQCAAGRCAAHIGFFLYAWRRTQRLFARRLRQQLSHRLQLLAATATIYSFHQMHVSVNGVAVLTFIVILALRAVVSISNDGRTSTLIASIIFMDSDKRIELLGDFWLRTFFGSNGHAIYPISSGAGFPCVILTLGGYAIVAEEITAKLVDRTVAWGVQSFLAVRWVNTHFEGNDILKELDDVAISFDWLGVHAKGTTSLCVPAAFAFKNLRISYLLKLNFPFPGAAGRTVLMMIRSTWVLHQ